MVQSFGLRRVVCEVRNFWTATVAHISQVSMTWWDVRLEHAPPDLLTGVRVLCLLLPLHPLSDRLGPSVTQRWNRPRKTIPDAYRLKALSNFLRSIFLGMDERRGRLAGEEATGSVTSASSPSTDWEIGWYSERFGIVEKEERSMSWGALRTLRAGFGHVRGSM